MQKAAAWKVAIAVHLKGPPTQPIPGSHGACTWGIPMRLAATARSVGRAGARWRKSF